MRQVDRTRPSMRVQVERSILRQPQLDTTRSRVNHPFPGGVALSLNAAAAGLGLQRAMHVMKLKSSGTCLRPDGAWRSLFQNQVPTASLAVKPSSDVGSMNGSAASAGIDVTLRAVEFNTARACMRAHAGAD